MQLTLGWYSMCSNYPPKFFFCILFSWKRTYKIICHLQILHGRTWQWVYFFEKINKLWLVFVAANFSQCTSMFVWVYQSDFTEKCGEKSCPRQFRHFDDDCWWNLRWRVCHEQYCIYLRILRCFAPTFKLNIFLLLLLGLF